MKKLIYVVRAKKWTRKTVSSKKEQCNRYDKAMNQCEDDEIPKLQQSMALVQSSGGSEMEESQNIDDVDAGYGSDDSLILVEDSLTSYVKMGST